VYRFFSLSYEQRMVLLRGLGLLEPGDGAADGAADADVVLRAFRRARAEGGLAALWSAVEARHPDGDAARNPFGGP
jgi:hypothetical protein